MAYEHQRTATGGYFIWLPRATVNKLERLRGRGEDIRAVIVRLFGEHAAKGRSTSLSASLGANSSPPGPRPQMGGRVDSPQAAEGRPGGLPCAIAEPSERRSKNLRQAERPEQKTEAKQAAKPTR